MIEINGYRLKRPEAIETPAMLLFQENVEHNIRRAIEVCGSADRLVPHFKTHKSSTILKQLLAAGIKSHKCATLKEAEVLANGGAREVVLAYPPAHPAKVRRLIALKKKFPELDLRTIASRALHLNVLSEAAVAEKVKIGVYVDLDTGMHRTGVEPGMKAEKLFEQASRLPGVRAIGIHLYDGQTGLVVDLAERQRMVESSYGFLTQLLESAERRGLEVSDTIVGTSWSFHLFPQQETIRVSPGTWIYWDLRNAMMAELPFKVAALVLGQVVDEMEAHDTVTVDIGSKAISDDLDLSLRFRILGHPQAELVAQSEEHGVVRRHGSPLHPGDFILAVPGHVCTTTVRYPYSLMVGAQGEISGRNPHDARDRD